MKSMAMKNGPPSRWSAHCATKADDVELLELFEQVFGHSMDQSQWLWKYSASPVRGILLRRADKAVAFFGGMSRCVQMPSAMVTAVQNGDVMVLPTERGVFTRQGALYQAASAFFDQLVGPGKLYAFAFGFPNERHFKLGRKLGLYLDSGRMVELSWSAERDKTHLRTVTSRLEHADIDAVVSNLWPKMEQGWKQHAIPQRDAERWMYRFAEHPVNHYEMLVVRHRFFREPLCALVLRQHAGHIEWLDFVGPLESTAAAIVAVRHFASVNQNKPVIALFSHDAAAAFSGEATRVLSKVCIPVNARPADECRPYVNNLWCMGGDTDFL